MTSPQIEADALAIRLQWAIIGVSLTTFYLLSAIAPSPERWALLSLGTGAFALAACASFLRGQPLGQLESMAASVGSMAVLLFPIALLGLAGISVIAACVGIAAIQLVWAVRRFPYERIGWTHSWRTDFRAYFKVAARIGGWLTLAVFILVCINTFNPTAPRGQVLTAYAMAVVGFWIAAVVSVAGAVLLRPLLQWPVGTILLGWMIGTGTYAVVEGGLFLGVPGLYSEAGVPEKLWAAIPLFVGLVLGGPLAMMYRDRHYQAVRLGGKSRHLTRA